VKDPSLSDGRALSLEDQARFPVQDPLEMNRNLPEMEKRVQTHKGYEPLFEKAFGDKQITLDQRCDLPFITWAILPRYKKIPWCSRLFTARNLPHVKEAQL